jgi:hypothetical protein
MEIFLGYNQPEYGPAYAVGDVKVYTVANYDVLVCPRIRIPQIDGHISFDGESF